MTKLEKYAQNKQALLTLVLKGDTIAVAMMQDVLAEQKYKLIQRGLLAIDADPEVVVDFEACAALFGELNGKRTNKRTAVVWRKAA